MIESHARRKKRQPIPKAVQRGRLRAAALSVWFSGHFFVCFSVACAWLRRAKRAALVYAKHTPWCQSKNYNVIKLYHISYKTA